MYPQNDDPSNNNNQISPNQTQNTDASKIQKMNLREDQFQINNSINTPLSTLIQTKKTKTEMKSGGNLISHPSSDNKGKYVKSIRKRLNIPMQQDIALSATLNSAAINRESNNITQINVNTDDLRFKTREGKSSFLVIFCVDGSGSMGVANRMETVKGVIFSILQDNYINRDKVALLIFRKDKAEMVLPPTRSVDLAHKLLKDIPTGGTTPLIDGISKALQLAEQEVQKSTGYIPLIVLISDGRGNIYANDPISDLNKLATKIAQRQYNLIVIDTDPSNSNLGLAKTFAKESNGIYYELEKITQESLSNILKSKGVVSY